MRPVLLHNFCSYLLFFCASTTQKLIFLYICPFLHICPFLNAERPPFQITAAICMYCLFRYARAFGLCLGFHNQSHATVAKLFFKVRIFWHKKCRPLLVVHTHPTRRKVKPQVARVGLACCRVLLRKLFKQSLPKVVQLS